MLKSLHIQNFAIIEKLELDFFSGMSALTGETGAGKSIIIDAIGLVLGDRADNNLIRAGKEAAEIILVIEIEAKSNSAHWLKENDFEFESECILRRVVRKDGKSKAYINGIPVPLKTLKELGECVINIYGQHAHQSLMNVTTQRELIDQFAGQKQNLSKLALLFTDWRKKNQRYEQISKNSSDIQATVELLRYQVEELDQLGLEVNEVSSLETKHKRLANAEELKKSTLQASHQLKNDESSDVYTMLNQICTQVSALLDNDKDLQATSQSLEEAFTIISECADDLRNYADGIEIDPEDLFQTEERLANIDQISRKHKVSPDDLIALHEKISQELTSLTQPEYDLDTLLTMLEKTESDYKALAKIISGKRKSVAKKLSTDITKALAKLGMEKARVEIAVSHDGNANPTSYGLDSIVFNVQTNPGQKMLPLSQVASGGELSRISLAIQMIAVDKLDVPVLIFDEVDSGVGGAVAEVVGRELRTIGEKRQVMCITHLAQVAANAHHHYRVNKQSEQSDTASAIEYLSQADRITEIARMIGGVTLTENTFLHAQEMLEAGIQ
ncbi:MAG: DNA repair protein RecN [Gammaproteobacteria bacterium]|nr:DNA repair protein RecN [Gammaproteobacteria bacterium]